MVRSTSSSRPMSGSILPSRAFLLRSTQKRFERLEAFLALLGRLRGLRRRTPALLLGAAHAPLLGAAHLGDAVGDVVDGVEARHLLLLQEVDGVAFALGEQRYQHVGAGDLFAARRLHVNRSALEDALEAGGRLGVLGPVEHQALELVVEVGGEILAQPVEIDAAGPHHRDRVLIVDEREQQVLERRELMTPLVGESEGSVQGLFQVAREHGLFLFKSALQRMLMLAGKIHDLRHLRLRRSRKDIRRKCPPPAGGHGA